MILSVGALAAADRARARAETQFDDVYADAKDFLATGYDSTEAYVLLCQRLAGQLDVDPEVDVAAATAIAMAVSAAVWSAQYGIELDQELGLAG